MNYPFMLDEALMFSHANSSGMERDRHEDAGYIVENDEKNIAPHRFRNDVQSRFARNSEWHEDGLPFQRWVWSQWLTTFFYREQVPWTVVKVGLSLAFGVGFKHSPVIRELVVAFQKESPWIFGTLIVGIALVAIPNALQHATDERSLAQFDFETVRSIAFYPVLVFCLSSIVGALWLVSGTSVGQGLARQYPIGIGTLAAFLTLVVVNEAYGMLVNRVETVLAGAVVEAMKDKDGL